MLLKEDTTTRNSIKGKLSSIISQLDDVDSSLALHTVDWLCQKANYTKLHYNHARFLKLPNNMQRGDIVRVEFGVNVGDEFSEHTEDGHFAMIWGQKGFLFIVIPLTKEPQPSSNEYAVDLGIISGLPGSINTYAKLEAIRSVSIRRIRRINEQPNGKISITDDAIINKIKDKIRELFL